MLPVIAPIRLRARLLAAPDGPRSVVHRGEHAIYVELDGQLAGVTSARATRVPCALWSTTPDLPSAGLTGERAELRGGCLVLDGRELRVGRVVDPRVRALTGLRASGHRLDSRLLEAMIGLGDGLTPLGDDVVSGWLVARIAAGAADDEVAHAVRRLATRTTALSATLLDCAARGEALPELADWLRVRAGYGTSPRRLEASTRALAAVGGSSGAGLLAGARLALMPAALDLPLTTHDRSVA